MQQSQRHLLAVACIVFAWIAIGGCSVNGSIREGDPRAIQYGKQLEPVVRRFQVAEARLMSCARLLTQVASINLMLCAAFAMSVLELWTALGLITLSSNLQSSSWTS